MKKLIERKEYVEKIENALKSVSIVVLIGARQVGKTSIMQMLDYSPSIFLNGQDPSNILLFEKEELVEEYIRINLNKELDGYVFIDEFQYIPKISNFLKLLTDKHENLKFICSGSSSLDIYQKVSESLAGRVRVINVFSLSYSEYLKFIDQSLYEEYQKYTLETSFEVINPRIVIELNNYLVYGGYPRVALVSNLEEKQELLNDIYQTYLLRDVRSYIRNEDFLGFNKLVFLLVLQIGNLVNINELSKSCRLSYAKCEEYINLLKQMFICDFLEPFSLNRKKEITKMKKVYFLDIGLRNIICKDFANIEYRKDSGELFENYVYLELLKNKKRIDSLFFYRTSDGLEIDFILKRNEEIFPIEVKFSNFDKPKSFRNLTVFMDNNDILKAFLFNRNLNSSLEVKSGLISYIPAQLLNKLW